MKHSLTCIVGLVLAVGCKANSSDSPPANAAKPTATSACPRAYRDVPDAQRAAGLTCACTSEATHGSVWGAGIYTTDSSICAAALHAGALPASGGGDVTVKPAAGCAVYAGTTANGVTSSSWGNFDASFYFAGKGNGTCTAVAAAAAPCPATYKQLTDAQRATDTTCSCPDGATGSVWGSGMYTTDSSICAAARHAGVLTGAGNVTVRGGAGCPSYQSASANGVSSGSWGQYEASFFFPAKGVATCTASAAALEACPASWVGHSGKLSCSCGALASNGSIYGTDIYTADSSLCRAAVHAGAIPATGGNVTVVTVPAGCQAFKASDRNSVKTTGWGAYNPAFYFEGFGTGGC